MPNRKVLLVCDEFPPQCDVGCLRPGMFAKYLPGYGWAVTVFTRVRPTDDPRHKPLMHIPGMSSQIRRFDVIHGSEQEAAVMRSRSFLQKCRHLLFAEETQPPGYCDVMLRAFAARCTDERFDVVLSSSPPLSTHRLGRDIARASGIPWVADFRDIMEQEARRPRAVREQLCRWRLGIRERQLIQSAAGVIVVSEQHRKIMRSKCKSDIYVIPNGYDPELFSSAPEILQEKFRIAYVGRILSEWVQDPRCLFQAVDRLLSEAAVDAADIELSFFGTESTIVERLAAPFACRRVVRVEPRVPYERVPQLLSQQTVLLVLTTQGSRGVLTTKIFEYLAVGRPVLCVPGDGDAVDTLLSQTSGGVVCSSVDSVVSTLRRWYEEWRETGTVMLRGDAEEIGRYSRKRQAAQLAGILEKVVNGVG